MRMLIVPAALLLAGFSFLAGREMGPASAFGSRNVTQVAIVVKDIEASARRYAEVFGVEVPGVRLTDTADKTHILYNGQTTTGRARLAFIKLDNLTLELIEPVGGPSTWQETLDARGEGVHHIAFRVDDIEDQVSFLQRHGGRLVQQGRFTGGRYAYVDASEPLGLVIELLASANP